MEIDSVIVIPVRSKKVSTIAEDELFPDAPLCKAQHKKAKSKLTAKYLSVAARLLAAAAKRSDHNATVGRTSCLYDRLFMLANICESRQLLYSWRFFRHNELIHWLVHLTLKLFPAKCQERATLRKL